MRRCAALCLLLIQTTWTLAACGDGPRAAPAADGSLRVDATTRAGRAALELWQLRPGVSFGEWYQQFVEDEISPMRPGDPAAEAWGTWCLKSSSVALVGEVPVRRTAFFYVPSPPDDLALPDAAPDLVRDCELGLIGIELPVRDTAAGVALADSLRRVLAHAYGGEADGPHPVFRGSAFWSHTGRYSAGAIGAASALVRPPAPGDSLAAVVAFAWLPVSGVSLDDARGPEAEDQAQPPPLESLVTLARLDTSLSAPLLRLHERAGRGPRDGAAGAGAETVRVLRRWVAASAELPAARRAAALYAADRVLEAAMCAVLPCGSLSDSVLYAPLRVLGARFGFPELGATWLYERSWMAQARALDRDSPLGQRIFLEQLAHAFDFSGTCRDGMDGWQRVVSNAERYLERLPASPIAAAVHYLAAEAWSDVVALAAGAGGDYADTSRYAPRSREARINALVHYEAAIVLAPASGTARHAWRRAWWLSAGFAPVRTRFLCVYD
jgi:hypothetical protein